MTPIETDLLEKRGKLGKDEHVNQDSSTRDVCSIGETPWLVVPKA